MEILNLLIEYKADLIDDDLGNSAIDEVIKAGQTEVLPLLLKAYGSFKVEKVNEMMLCVALNDTAKMKLYIDSGYAVNIVNRYGRTPLHLAADNKLREMC